MWFFPPHLHLSISTPSPPHPTLLLPLTFLPSLQPFSLPLHTPPHTHTSCRADSITWDSHKMLTVPLYCSALLVRHKGLLTECNSAHATYLFQKDKVAYDTSLDTGDMTIQCGRINDALKIWIMWKAMVRSCIYVQHATCKVWPLPVWFVAHMVWSLPVWCDLYLCGVIFTCVVWSLPVWCDLCLCGVIFTCVVWSLPVWCDLCLCGVTFACVVCCP